MLGQELGMKLTAEGIETEEQLSNICNMECDLGQGFLFARPQSSERMATLLKTKDIWRGQWASLRNPNQIRQN